MTLERHAAPGWSGEGRLALSGPREAAAQAREAVRILEAGAYTASSGRAVLLAGAIARAVAGTAAYPPGAAVERCATGPCETAVRVVNASTLEAARALADAGRDVAVLNFGSAAHPGGGFLAGALAQEEALCRATALYACLRNRAFYDHHRARPDPLHSDYALYSPAVPVFRDESGTLLEEPWEVAVITAAAPHARRLPAERHDEVPPAFRRRILKVLALGAAHRHDALVLGAWGCGAFGNDPRLVASLFRRALSEDFRGAFRRVTFAVLDRSPGQSIIRPFLCAFEKGR